MLAVSVCGDQEQQTQMLAVFGIVFRSLTSPLCRTVLCRTHAAALHHVAVKQELDVRDAARRSDDEAEWKRQKQREAEDEEWRREQEAARDAEVRNRETTPTFCFAVWCVL